MAIELRRDARPDYVPAIVGLHEDYYVREWGFGDAFVEKITEHLTDFLQRYDASRDLLLTAHQDGSLVGSLVMDAGGDAGDGVKLRWFIIGASARGHGLGRQMMDEAMGWCDQRGYDHCTLSTFGGLKAAGKLYRRYGFKLVSEIEDDPWGAGVGEQIYEYRAPVTDAHAH